MPWKRLPSPFCGGAIALQRILAVLDHSKVVVDVMNALALSASGGWLLGLAIATAAA